MKVLILCMLVALSQRGCCDAAIREANGRPTPFLEFGLQVKTPLQSSTTGWHFLPGDYNKDGTLDMFCIKPRGAVGTEVHILNGKDNYKTYLLQTHTALHKTSEDFDFTLGDYNGDGKLDVWAIKKYGSSMTEIHILDGSNWDRWLLQTTTPLHTTDAGWDFHAGDWNNDGKIDLIGIKRRGVDGTEVHVLDGKSSFQHFNLHSKTAQTYTDGTVGQWSFAVADFNGDGQLDLYTIKGQGVRSTEIHVLNGKNLHQFLLNTHTGLHKTNTPAWVLTVADYDGDRKPDMIAVNTQETSIHVLRSESNLLFWSDPNIWSGGSSVPTSGDQVVIPAGKQVILDQDATIHNLEIQGKLVVQDSKDLSLTADWILVNNGQLHVGSEDHPYKHSFIITLDGEQDVSDPEKDKAFLKVQGPHGQLELHGVSRSKRSWTKLDGTLPKGENAIIVESPIDWLEGDKIVIASTDFDMNQAEEFTVMTVSEDGLLITLDAAANFTHFGSLQKYSNGKRSWVLDERAEVGLLSRNIVIQGGPNAARSKYGGHVMILSGASARVEGVEFRTLGQYGVVGRYPFHWHMLGETKNQYFKWNSIHHTYNRALTIHGTSNTVVEENVAYDHIGHGYFLEDGSEYGNEFIYNLGLVTRQMSLKDATIPTDHDHVSTYWITNPDNSFVGNVAGGSDHSGFWIAPPITPTGASKSQTNIKPIYTPMKEFRRNTGHSNAFANLAIEGSPDQETGALKETNYQPRTADGKISIPIISDFTSYKCKDRAIWTRANTMVFSNIISADNGRATFFAYSQTMKDSLIVGRSKNVGDGSFNDSFRGHSIYDGPSGIDQVHFAGFKNNDFAIQTNGAAQKSPVHWARGITFANDIPPTNQVEFGGASFVGYMWSSGLRDLDGSITGRPGSIITPWIRPPKGRANAIFEDKFNVAEQATLRPEWGAWVNEGGRFGLLRVDPQWPQYSAEQVQVTRCGGTRGCQTVSDNGTYHWYYQNPAILNQGFSYQFSFPKLPRKFAIKLAFANNGDSVLIKIANVPPGTQVALGSQVNSREALESAGSTSYLIQAGHLWVKLVASGLETNPTSSATQPFGNEFSASARVEVTISAGTGDRYNILADYNSGVDHRGSLGSTAGATYRGLFTGWDDTINWWDVVSEGNGQNGFVDYILRFPNEQDWTFFQALVFKTTLSGENNIKPFKYQAWVKDAVQDHMALGECQTGDCQFKLNALGASGKIARVQFVMIRVHIDFFAEVNQKGAFQRVHLDSITLA